MIDGISIVEMLIILFDLLTMNVLFCSVLLTHQYTHRPQLKGHSFCSPGGRLWSYLFEVFTLLFLSNRLSISSFYTVVYPVHMTSAEHLSVWGGVLVWRRSLKEEGMACCTDLKAPWDKCVLCDIRMRKGFKARFTRTRCLAWCHGADKTYQTKNP